MNILKLDLSKNILAQTEQGKKVIAMSKIAMPGPQPTIDALETKNNALIALKETADEARQTYITSFSALRAGAKDQKNAYIAHANTVENAADGDAAFVLSTGYGVRATPKPYPAFVPVTGIITRINGTPGRVVLTWIGQLGARNYEIQYTTDLTGASGWVNAPSMPGKTRLNVDGLVSGTRYAFRIRACGNAEPGPWSSPVQQMVP
jgi:hypothetical protein